MKKEKRYKLSNPEVISLMDFIEQQGQMKWSQVDRLLAKHITDLVLILYDYGHAKVVSMPYYSVNTRGFTNIYDEKLVRTFSNDILRNKVECMYSNVYRFLEESITEVSA